jgi:hypothetical protein
MKFLAQHFQFFRQVHDQLDARQIDAALGTEVLNSAECPNCLIIKPPAAVGGIDGRRHQPKIFTTLGEIFLMMGA